METTDQISNVEVKARTKKTPTIPNSQIVLSGVANSASDEWKVNTDFTLRYMSCNAFADMAAQFHAGINNALAIKAALKPLEQGIKDLNKKIMEGLPNIKNYLTEKYGKDGALAYYQEFGIVKEGTAYILPAMQEKRDDSLVMMLKGINAEGFNAVKYGKEYWQPISNRYSVLLKQSNDFTRNLSKEVSDKKVRAKSIKRVLNSLIYLIKANYPDTYKAEMRKWGFLKEKY